MLDFRDRCGQRVRVFHQSERVIVDIDHGAVLREQCAGDKEQRHEHSKRTDRALSSGEAHRASDGRPQRQIIQQADQPVEQQYGADQPVQQAGKQAENKR